MFKYSYLLTGLVALAVLLAGCGERRPAEQQPTGAQAEAPAETPAEPAGAPGEAAWLTSLEEGLRQASAQGKPLVVDFYADWCGPCKMLDEQTWPDERVVEALKPYVAVRVDVDAHRDLAQEYRISGIPAIVFMDSAGKEQHRQVGFVDAATMTELLKQYAPAAEATK